MPEMWEQQEHRASSSEATLTSQCFNVKQSVLVSWWQNTGKPLTWWWNTDGFQFNTVHPETNMDRSSYRGNLSDSFRDIQLKESTNVNLSGARNTTWTSLKSESASKVHWLTCCIFYFILFRVQIRIENNHLPFYGGLSAELCWRISVDPGVSTGCQKRNLKHKLFLHFGFF